MNIHNLLASELTQALDWNPLISPIPVSLYSQQFEWPSITIVTPTYNQGSFIEKTIQSVLNQNYPNLQYIICDGGSTDNTVEIIKKYENYLAMWVSEPDRGQTHAINKGLAKASGSWFNWLNSDDFLAPGALYKIGVIANQHPNADFIGGKAAFVSEIGDLKMVWDCKFPDHGKIKDFINTDLQIPQPSVFINRNLINEIGNFDEKLTYVMDYEFYLRSALKKKYDGLKVCVSENILSVIIAQNQSKSMTGYTKFKKEWLAVNLNHITDYPENDQRSIHEIAQRKLRMIEQIEKIDRSNSISSLIQLLIRHPQFCVSRYYLGKLKRTLFN